MIPRSDDFQIRKQAVDMLAALLAGKVIKGFFNNPGR